MIDWDEIETAQPRVVTPPTKEPHRNFGCLMIVLLVVVLFLTFVGGNFWVALSSPLGGTLWSIPLWQQDLVISFGYGGGVLLLGGLFALLGRWTRYKPWQGIGLVLALAALHAAVSGSYLSLYHYPFGIHIPTWPYAIFSLFLAVVLWLSFVPWLGTRPDDPAYDSKPANASIGFSLLLGFMATGVFVFGGSLGTMGETLAAVAEAFAIAGFGTAVLVLPFRYQPQFAQQRPGLAIFYSGLLLIGLAPGLFAGRGFLAQSGIVGNSLPFLALLGAVVLTLAPQPDVRRTWLNSFSLLFAGLLTPMVLSDSLEMEFIATLSETFVMLLLISAAICLFLFVVMLAFRRFFTKLWGWRLVGGLLGLGAIAGLGAAYLLSGGSLLQPNTFVVVLNTQADTTFAREIEDRDERVTAVYDTLTAHAREDQNLIRGLLNATGAAFTPFYLVNGLEVRTFNPLLRWQLSTRPEISHILRSPQARQPRTVAFLSGTTLLPLSSSPAPTQLPWGLRELEVETVWRDLGIRGEGVVVGIADSGSSWQHPALADNYRGADGDHHYNWYDPVLKTTEPVDDDGGHGTHTTGTSVGGNGIGVAPGAEWIACRNLPLNLGNPADYLTCMEFLFAPFPLEGDPFVDGDPTLGAHVTNNSWGCPFQEGCDGETLGLGTLQLRNAGQMMVVSAGNDGPSCDTVGIPANNDDVFSVGALGPDGTIASFSSRGPALDYDDDVLIKPDIVAPGVDVISSVPTGYRASSGTSMAGPHVAGVVALLWSANPDLIGDIDATEQILLDTAVVADLDFLSPCGPMSDGEVNNTYGVGVVNALAAVEAALNYDK